MKLLLALLISVCVLAAPASLGASWSSDAAQPLPRVLIIGDSISLGYTPFVRQKLNGVAEVVHNPGNAEDTRNGLARLDEWLKGGGKWDIIHFNWGLWDLKEQGTAVPLAEYEKNLRALVKRLRATGAKLIWANTTPVPAQNRHRRRDDDVLRYNLAAWRIMREHHVAVHDLYAAGRALEREQIPDDVHFTDRGYEKLAESVARSLSHTLKGQPLAAAGTPVICFGDSITAGVGAGPDTRWEAVLQKLGTGRIQTINEGMSGRTLADAVSPREQGRFSNGRQEPLLPDNSFTLVQHVVMRHPEAEMVVVALGVNDLKNNRTDGADKSALALRNAATLVDQIRAVRPELRIVLCCPANINPQTVNEVNRGKKYDEQTHAWIKALAVKLGALAKSKKTAYCNLEPVVSPENYTDGLHPDERGHRQIAHAVWATLRQELASRQRK